MIQDRIWHNDAVALWRPGGCIDTRTFLPKLYAYLKKMMGQYKDGNSELQDCFQLHFSHEVIGLEFAPNSDKTHLIGLKFSNGTFQIDDPLDGDSRYVFCPGEAVGCLSNLGLSEPNYAAFAGASLFTTIPLKADQIEQYKNFSHCMEVHNEGIVLAWQARFIDNNIFIGVAGTKAFYGDKQPSKDETFARNRNLVQLNMINDVLPEFISLAYGRETCGQVLTEEDLTVLEEKGVTIRWVGRRAVAYDGFPTMGPVYSQGRRVDNARCTTHLGSGGVSFGPGAVYISRCSEQVPLDELTVKLLHYADSRRKAE